MGGLPTTQDAPSLGRWRQRLGLEYWYRDCSEIQDALEGYTGLHEDGAAVQAPPLPPYMEDMRSSLPAHRLTQRRLEVGSRLRCDAAFELLTLHGLERSRVGEGELEAALRAMRLCSRLRNSVRRPVRC